MADEFAGALCERVVIEAWVPARDDAGADGSRRSSPMAPAVVTGKPGARGGAGG